MLFLWNEVFSAHYPYFCVLIITMKKIFFLFILSILLWSCARVGSPVGGDKDTLAPKFLSSNIDSSRINVPRNIKELRINFDEYINLKDINKNLIISPPIKKIKKILPTNLATKFLLIQWEDTLQENTTYNFNFGNAIVDLNEANAIPYYNFAFSTGPEIDNLYISGEVTDALGDKKSNSNAKESNYVVGLYQVKDTMDYRQKPYYITKVDPDSYFELNYLSPGEYRILAFDDENQNSIFDQGKEKVAFKKESVKLEDKSISGLSLKLFSSKGKSQYKEKKDTPGGLLYLYEGNPEQVKLTSYNDKLQDYKVTHLPKSDSVFVWFDAVKSNLGIDKNENLKFFSETPTKNDTIKSTYRYNPKQDVFTISRKGDTKIAVDDLFKISSNLAVQKIDTEKWTLVSDSIAQTFTAEIAKDNPFQINFKGNLEPGKKYQLDIPKATVHSYYKVIEQSFRFNFETEKPENMGSLTLNLVNIPEHQFWVQLLDGNSDIVYSKLTKNSKVQFINLKPGDYRFRILVDNNDNGVWDASDFSTETLAEDVYLFRKNKDINPMTKINIRPMWEINETWDLKLEIQN